MYRMVKYCWPSATQFLKATVLKFWKIQEEMPAQLRMRTHRFPLIFSWNRSVQLNSTFAGKSFKTAGFGYILPRKKSTNRAPAGSNFDFLAADSSGTFLLGRFEEDPVPMPRQSRPLGIRRSGETHLMKNDESSSPWLEIIPNNGEKHGTTHPRITGLGFGGEWWVFMA